MYLEHKNTSASAAYNRQRMHDTKLFDLLEFKTNLILEQFVSLGHPVSSGLKKRGRPPKFQNPEPIEPTIDDFQNPDPLSSPVRPIFCVTVQNDAQRHRYFSAMQS